jgi:hypothetical protein
MSILATPVAVGANLPNSVADVTRVPFPEDWMQLLREVNPVTDHHSYLLPYWYRAGERWVLYDCVPRNLIPDDETPVCVGLSGKEFLARVTGPPPRERESWDECAYVSDVQHEFYRVHQVYARPFWVLQGNHGGHQVSFEPWQQNLLAAQQLPHTPPKIGMLEACPFDNRTVAQLRTLSRLQQMAGNVDALRRTGTKDGSDALLAHRQKQIREAELQFLEQQMAPLLDCAKVVHQRADSDDHLCYVQPGTAGKVAEALDVYRETGDFIL